MKLQSKIEGKNNFFPTNGIETMVTQMNYSYFGQNCNTHSNNHRPVIISSRRKLSQVNQMRYTNGIV